jgi:hypothetical protein
MVTVRSCPGGAHRERLPGGGRTGPHCLRILLSLLLHTFEGRAMVHAIRGERQAGMSDPRQQLGAGAGLRLTTRNEPRTPPCL